MEAAEDEEEHMDDRNIVTVGLRACTCVCVQPGVAPGNCSWGTTSGHFLLITMRKQSTYAVMLDALFHGHPALLWFACTRAGG